MPDKKEPVVIGGIDTTNDPALKRYKAGIAKRAEARRAATPGIGNLAEANETYRPSKDGPMTIANITKAGEITKDRDPTGLKPETIEIMKAVHAATQKAQEAKQGGSMENAQAAPPQPQAPQQPSTQSLTPPPSEEAKRKATVDALGQMDDLEYERLMASIRNDSINNEKERDHVGDPKNKRITEIDFAAGIADGEFKQIVDVIPGRLKVHYRTTTPLEEQGVRLWLFKLVSTDPRFERLAPDVFALSMVVLSVQQINGNAEVDHLKRVGAAVYGAEFDEDAFQRKYQKFLCMPGPLLHSVGTHGQWFDQRVRKLFTTDFAKNG